MKRLVKGLVFLAVVGCFAGGVSAQQPAEVAKEKTLTGVVHVVTNSVTSAVIVTFNPTQKGEKHMKVIMDDQGRKLAAFADKGVKLTGVVESVKVGLKQENMLRVNSFGAMPAPAAQGNSNP